MATWDISFQRLPKYSGAMVSRGSCLQSCMTRLLLPTRVQSCPRRGNCRIFVKSLRQGSISDPNRSATGETLTQTLRRLWLDPSWSLYTAQAYCLGLWVWVASSSHLQTCYDSFSFSIHMTHVSNTYAVPPLHCFTYICAATPFPFSHVLSLKRSLLLPVVFTCCLPLLHVSLLTQP